MPSKSKTSQVKRYLNSPLFWIFLATLPALLLYGNRFLIPDMGTDVISYHLFNGQRAVTNPFLDFTSSEFYPVGIATVAPGYDLINFAARLVLGYRLGTILDLLATIGCIIIIYKLMQMILREHQKKFHAGWGLLLVNAAIILELYFQLATYFVDILNAFLILLVFYWVLRTTLRRGKETIRLQIWTLQWLALGILLALKLTNAGLVLPIAGMLAWDLYKRRHSVHGKHLVTYVVLMACLLLPLVPAAAANYRQSGNPLFPYYNAIFGSKYYPSDTSYLDTTFGGQTIAQKVVWPVASLPDQMKLGEPHHIYNDYKLVTYWLVAVLLGVLVLSKRLRLGPAQRAMIGYFLASVLLWGLTYGVNRYLISTLLLGGLMIVILIASLSQWQRNWRYFGIGLCALVCAVVLVENYRIFHFNMRYDISWRPPLYQNQELHSQQRKALFTRHLNLSADEQATVSQADILLNCHTNVSGLLSLMPTGNDKPVVNIISADLPQYADMADNQAYRDNVLQRLHNRYPGQTTFTWATITSDTIGPTTPDCLKNIADRGGKITTTHPITSFVGYQNVQLQLVSGTIKL